MCSLPKTSCLRCGWVKWSDTRQEQGKALRCSSAYVRPIKTTLLQPNGNYGKRIKDISACVEWEVSDERQA